MKHNIFNKIVICLILILSLAPAFSFGQRGPSKDLSRALQIGDSFTPPHGLTVMRGGMQAVDWKALDNKVIVLDFFDTYCGACVKAMPKLQRLQEKLGDKLQIFTVTWQDASTIEKFFGSNAYMKEHKVNLPIIYSDSLLKPLFPHAGIPHIAVIFKGKVKAITMSEFITEENMLGLYETGGLKVPLKNDFADRGNLAGHLIVGVLEMKAGTLISGYQDGVPSHTHGMKTVLDSISGKYKTSSYNFPLLTVLRQAWLKLKTPTYIPRPERLVWKVASPQQYDDINGEGEVWLAQNAICYERYDLVARADSLQGRVILNDLHNYFGIRTYFDTKEMDCLVLRPCPVVPYEGPAFKEFMSYEDSGVLATMIDVTYMFPPSVDLVKSKTKIKIGTYENLDGLNKQLRAYGMEAKIEKAIIEVFVVEEVN
ncbi:MULTISPECIES: TlpA family protein disulfide reductase [Sphingobacterium]|uniref:TlpA family protein disulfide reductase n=1 Tax=Sphingobacterium TaxID=28453 RepID=UPI0013DC596B|nr:MULTISPECIES: TlpA disulfide reductase family protein [unclassified Sphingobacterium]